MNDWIAELLEKYRQNVADNRAHHLPKEPHDELWEALEACLQREDLHLKRIKVLEQVAKEFVAKVDRGEARSVRTYAAFKAALAKGEPE